MEQNTIVVFKLIDSYAITDIRRKMNHFFAEQIPLNRGDKAHITRIVKHYTTEYCRNLEELGNVFRQNHYNINYYVVLNNYIVGIFEHAYDVKEKEFYLSCARVTKNKQGQGIGTKAYKLIKKDIFDNFKVEVISALVVNEYSSKMLANNNFIPEFRHDKITNAILINKKSKFKLASIKNVKKSVDVLSPNKDKYKKYLKTKNEDYINDNDQDIIDVKAEEITM